MRAPVDGMRCILSDPGLNIWQQTHDEYRVKAMAAVREERTFSSVIWPSAVGREQPFAGSARMGATARTLSQVVNTDSLNLGFKKTIFSKSEKNDIRLYNVIGALPGCAP